MAQAWEYPAIGRGCCAVLHSDKTSVGRASVPAGTVHAPGPASVGRASVPAGPAHAPGPASAGRASLPAGPAHAPRPASVGRASVPAGPEPSFSRYRRRLPHWRLTGAIYFVTWRLRTTQPDLSPMERDRIVAALRHFDRQRYDLFTFVVMNDHVHALVQPRADCPLESILHSWKSFTAREFQRHYGRLGAVWQDESFDRIVRDENEFWQKIEYIQGNAAKRWAEFPDSEYPWAWLRQADEGGMEARPADSYTEDLARYSASGPDSAGTEARPTGASPGPAGTEARPTEASPGPAGKEARPTGASPAPLEHRPARRAWRPAPLEHRPHH